MKQNNLVRITDLTDDDIDAILGTASVFLKKDDHRLKLPVSLAGYNICLLFFEPSTRTRMSFELASHRLGATVSTFVPLGSSISKGESANETVATVSHMGFDLLVIRSALDGLTDYAATLGTTPVLSGGETTVTHPTQALLDASAIMEARGSSLHGERIVIVGDVRHSRVARSQAELFIRLGATVALCAPPEFQPLANDEVFRGIPTLESVSDALEWGTVVSMLRIQHERLGTDAVPGIEHYRRQYALTTQHLVELSTTLVIHPGPVNEGVEIDGELLTHKNVLIHRQVTHGVAVRMAVLQHMLS